MQQFLLPTIIITYFIVVITIGELLNNLKTNKPDCKDKCYKYYGKNS